MAQIFTVLEVYQIQSAIKLLESADQKLPWQETDNRLEILGLGQTVQAIRVSIKSLQNVITIAAIYGNCPNTRKAIGK